AFVRRVYLAGGGGDGGGGLGPLPPPVPPDGLGGEPWRAERTEGPRSGEGVTAADLLLHRASAFQTLRASAARDAATAVEWWDDKELKLGRGDTDHNVLAHAAALLVDCMLRRFPRTNNESFDAWREACSRLGATIDGFALWPFLL